MGSFHDQSINIVVNLFNIIVELSCLRKNNDTLFDITICSFNDQSLYIVVYLFYIIMEQSCLRKKMTNYSI